MPRNDSGSRAPLVLGLSSAAGLVAGLALIAWSIWTILIASPTLTPDAAAATAQGGWASLALGVVAVLLSVAAAVAAVVLARRRIDQG